MRLISAAVSESPTRKSKSCRWIICGAGCKWEAGTVLIRDELGERERAVRIVSRVVCVWTLLLVLLTLLLLTVEEEWGVVMGPNMLDARGVIPLPRTLFTFWLLISEDVCAASAESEFVIAWLLRFYLFKAGPLSLDSWSIDFAWDYERRSGDMWILDGRSILSRILHATLYTTLSRDCSYCSLLCPPRMLCSNTLSFSSYSSPS